MADLTKPLRVCKVEMRHDIETDIIEYKIMVPGELLITLENAAWLVGPLLVFVEEQLPSG